MQHRSPRVALLQAEDGQEIGEEEPEMNRLNHVDRVALRVAGSRQS